MVPTLVHDGKPVIESTLICEYLDETFPQPPLVPTDPWQRSRMRIWSKLVDEGLFEGVTEISFSAMFRERMRSMPEELRQRRFQNIGDPRRRDRFKSTYELGARSPFVLHAIAAYDRAFGLLEDTLAEGGPWIVGARATLADINLMPFAARLDYLGLIDLWTEGRPRVSEWWAMAREWPSFKRGLSDLISDAEFAEMRTHGPRSATTSPPCWPACASGKADASRVGAAFATAATPTIHSAARAMTSGGISASPPAPGAAWTRAPKRRWRRPSRGRS